MKNFLQKHYVILITVFLIVPLIILIWTGLFFFIKEKSISREKVPNNIEIGTEEEIVSEQKKEDTTKQKIISSDTQSQLNNLYAKRKQLALDRAKVLAEPFDLAAEQPGVPFTYEQIIRYENLKWEIIEKIDIQIRQIDSDISFLKENY